MEDNICPICLEEFAIYSDYKAGKINETEFINNMSSNFRPCNHKFHKRCMNNFIEKLIREKNSNLSNVQNTLS